jgi:prepilin-type N-terminal cleavage/methylation domain-containing protein
MRRPARTRGPTRIEHGFTLIEVLLVIVLVGIMGSVAFRSMDVALDSGRWEETSREMDRLGWAIVGNPDLLANGTRTDFGYVGDVGSLPPNLDALVANPGGYATWRGPYIRNVFAEGTNDYELDAWGNSYTYAGGVTLTSSGSGGSPTVRKLADVAADLTSNTVHGTVTDGGGNPPGNSNFDVSIRITYPNGTGGTATASTNPDAAGAYSFASVIPQGLHTVTAVVGATGDSLSRTAAVLPGSSCALDLRFCGNLWGSPNGRLAYVAGTAGTLSSGRTISFDVRNNGASAVTITSLKATYSHAPVSYYPRITWAGTTVALNWNPRFASAELVTFSSSQTIAAGGTANIQLQNFRECSSGFCNDANMAGTTFTIEFSEGSMVSFAV